MRVHSSTVEDVFHIESRGCVVVPGLLLHDSPYVLIGDPAILRRPDGITIETRIAGIEMITSGNQGCMPVLLSDNVAKSDIPIGTLLEITESHVRDNRKDQPQFKVGERLSLIHI